MNTIQINNIIFHYQKAGSGKPVVLVHGNGEDHTIFKTEIEQLVSAGYCVYAPDSRGHGATGANNPPVKEFHYTDMADDIYAFIQALHLEKPAYYGHSDGGIIGLLLELRHPGTVGIMAISGTNLSPAGLDESFVAECQKMYDNSLDPLTALMLHEPHIEPAHLERIMIPVLVTAGEHDLIKAEETRRIAESLPQSKLTIIENADHGSYVVNSEIMGEVLIQFLQEHGC